MKFKRLKSSINIRYWLLGLLLIAMTTATTNFLSWSMAGLTVFLLAYVSKGMRRYPNPQSKNFEGSSTRQRHSKPTF